MQPLKIKEFVTHLHALSLILMSLTSLIILKIINCGLCEINIKTEIHLGFCVIVSPLIFYTIPLTIILILNVLLVHKLVKYFKNHQQINETNNQEIQLSLFETQASTSRKSMSNSIKSPLRKFGGKQKNNRDKKIQYFVIILSDIYSILTSIFYYSLSSVFILFQLNFFYMETIIKLQILSSVFFNSNYLIYFFIHLAFNDDFRNVFKKYFFLAICFKDNESVVVIV